MPQKAASSPLLPGLGGVAYSPTRGIFDEMMTADMTLRPQWQGLVEGLAALEPGDMARRWERGQRLIRDNGVTYNVYGEGEGLNRPWRLDPVPMVIDGAEWRGIEKALAQRATLFNDILTDLYGRQRLLSGGHIPPALVFANPAFVHAVQGATTIGPPLQFYAADLARSPDGRWWVIGDRAEAPSGAGYALENRTIVGRMMPDLYRACGVERLGDWFVKVRDALVDRSPLNKESPRIVLLTPGPYNETWFEHAYLARQLGLILVEGEDLTVRDGRVHLKTTEGLKLVDVMLRRTDSGFCDPLELRPDSALGVPGLVEAVHRGSIVMANGLGSGLMESPAFMAFLPTLCRTILGEDLLMPSVATWWCGEEEECDYVIDNLDRLALRPAFAPMAKSVRGALLSKAERETWVARLRDEGQMWVAQEAVDLSTAPVWVADKAGNGRIEPRPVAIRAYAAVTNEGWSVMPGGLGRTAAAPREQSLSMQDGGGSKDVWIINAKPHETARPLAHVPTKVVRGAADLPSRLADNMFWLGRYLERSENICRMLRSAVFRAMEGPEAAAALSVSLHLFRRLGHIESDIDLTTVEAQETALRDLIALNLDAKKPYGLASTISSIQRVATVARDRLSLDTWRAVGLLPERLAAISPGKTLDFEEVTRGLSASISGLMGLAGLAQESMTRGLGWRFMDIGRRVERALHVLDMLEAPRYADNTSLTAALDLVLETLDSQMTYRTRYLSLPTFVPTLDLVLVDESNPRSFAFQVARLTEHVDLVAPDRQPLLFTSEQRLMMSLQATVRTVSVEHIHLGGPRDESDPAASDHASLGAVTMTLRDDLYRLVDTLIRRTFVHAAEARAARGLPLAAAAEGEAVS